MLALLLGFQTIDLPSEGLPGALQPLCGPLCGCSELLLDLNTPVLLCPFQCGDLLTDPFSGSLEFDDLQDPQPFQAVPEVSVLVSEPVDLGRELAGFGPRSEHTDLGVHVRLNRMRRRRSRWSRKVRCPVGVAVLRGSRHPEDPADRGSRSGASSGGRPEREGATNRAGISRTWSLGSTTVTRGVVQRAPNGMIPFITFSSPTKVLAGVRTDPVTQKHKGHPR